MNILIRYASPTYSNDLYDDYCKSGLLQDVLHISEKGLEEIAIAHFTEAKKIYFADSHVASETATAIAERYNIKDLELLPELKNIKHDFTKYIQKSELNDLSKMLYLRKQFFTDLINDKLLEEKSDIINRFMSLKKFLDTETNAIFVTHGLTLVALKIFLTIGFDTSIENFGKVVDFSLPFYGSLKGFSYPTLDDITVL